MEITQEKKVSEMTETELEQILKQKKEAKRLKSIGDKKALQELDDDFIDKYIDPLFKSHDSVNGIVTNMFKDFEIIKPFKIEVKGVKVDKQCSHTLTHTDKDRSLTIGYNTVPAFDGTETEGITVIKNFLSTLAGDDPHLILANKIINILLKTNPKTGELNVSKAMELNAMRRDFNSEEFDIGIDILLNARFNKITSSFVSGWKNIEKDGRIVNMKFRFSI